MSISYGFVERLQRIPWNKKERSDNDKQQRRRRQQQDKEKQICAIYETFPFILRIVKYSLAFTNLNGTCNANTASSHSGKEKICGKRQWKTSSECKVKKLQYSSSNDTIHYLLKKQKTHRSSGSTFAYIYQTYM